MGGWGSGWRGTKKTTVEDCLKLSVADLVRIGALDPGWREGSLSWRRGEEHVATIEYSTSISPDGEGTLWLKYSANGELQHYTVTLLSTLPHYGGRRWWFICPVKKIRVSDLLLPPGASQFASRQAYNLTYRSCQESGSAERFQRSVDALIRRSNNLDD